MRNHHFPNKIQRLIIYVLRVLKFYNYAFRDLESNKGNQYSAVRRILKISSNLVHAESMVATSNK